MNRLDKKIQNKVRRKVRIRSKVYGTSECPRLTITISNLHVSAQLIDDTSASTIAYSTTIGQKNLKGTMSEKAQAIGTDIAKKAKQLKVSKIVFDRNGKLYHGRIKALADAARAEGLEF